MITNDGYMNHHQKAYRDYQVTFPKKIYQIENSNTQQEIYNELTKMWDNNLYIDYTHIIIINLHTKKNILSFTFKLP